MADRLMCVSVRMDPDTRDVLPGMLRALREALDTGRLSWSRYLGLRDTITDHVQFKHHGLHKAPDGTLVLSCHLDPSPEFLSAVGSPWGGSGIALN